VLPKAKPVFYEVMPLVSDAPTRTAEVRSARHPLPAPVEVPPQEAKLTIHFPGPAPVAEVAPPEPPHADQAQVLPALPAKPAIQDVQAGAFFSGSEAAPALSRPAREVQTGGFGAPDGLRGQGAPGAKLTVANVGSFDLPTGSGSGNGTAGTSGLRGTVASAGFGNGIAVDNNDHTGSRNAIQQAGFGDVRPVNTPRVVRASAPEALLATPVQILSKVTPAYTDEARQQRIEGEVLLEVAFPAAGQCHVLRVVRGLGHGLDEAAVRAAQQIRFRPATRGGMAVNSTATLHVLFQLAY
jgi:TonB family protein